MSRHFFVLAHDQARSRAVDCVRNAPAGYSVEVCEPTRSGVQNSLLWVLLTAFSEQLRWPVNGSMVRLSPEDWKTLLTAAYRRESQRVAQGIDGGMVMLGMSTSKLGKREFAELIEFIHSVAADRGVELERETV
jgi:hypothetical protein